MSQRDEDEMEARAKRYWYMLNVRQNSSVYPFAIWDQPSPSESSRIVGFAVGESTARNIVHQLKTFGYVECDG